MAHVMVIMVSVEPHFHIIKTMIFHQANPCVYSYSVSELPFSVDHGHRQKPGHDVFSFPVKHESAIAFGVVHTEESEQQSFVFRTRYKRIEFDSIKRQCSGRTTRNTQGSFTTNSVTHVGNKSGRRRSRGIGNDSADI